MLYYLLRNRLRVQEQRSPANMAEFATTMKCNLDVFHVVRALALTYVQQNALTTNFIIFFFYPAFTTLTSLSRLTLEVSR